MTGPRRARAPPLRLRLRSGTAARPTISYDTNHRKPDDGCGHFKPSRWGQCKPSLRFGRDDRRFGGIGDVEPVLERYAAATGLNVAVADLYWWEVLGNVKWGIGSLTQALRHLRGRERSIELAALGRPAAEMEFELLDLIERAA